MPIIETTAEQIACDNPACPGIPAALEPTARTGWWFVIVEHYGSPVVSRVYCTPRCVAQGLAALKASAPAA